VTRRLIVAAVLLLAPGPARGQDRPWAEGVSDEQQLEALRLLEEGNRQFELAQRAMALATYRRAIAVWDHPAIRYNIAVALIDQDQPLEAYENLELALRYGQEALLEDQYAQGLTYRKLLLGQLAQLQVVCGEPGARVLLDGRELLVGPGEVTRVLLPGEHSLVATKAEYLTATRTVNLVAGRTETATLALVAVPRAVETRRRWAAWKPWAVVGAGAAVALAGVPLRLLAASTMDDYERAFTAACPQGCVEDQIPSAARDLRSRARLESGVAIALFAAGGATLAGGVVWMIANQPRPVHDRQVALVPVVGMGGAGLSVVGSF
jgi:tetratricopeptide (TPR) repeat protein